jgi:hypothetical protein
MFGIFLNLVRFVWHTPELYCPWIFIGVAIGWVSIAVWNDRFSEYHRPCHQVKWSHIMFPFHLNNTLPVWWNPPVNALFSDWANYNKIVALLTAGIYIIITSVIWPVRLFFNLLVLLIQAIVVRLDNKSLLANL